MLKRLTIRNVALIDRAEIEFSEGMNVLTGETGAGKSVILDSIDFVLGAKADKSMLRTGEKECCVTAEFSAGDELLVALRALDIEAEEGDDIVITRRYTEDGRGGIKLNGAPVSASMLRRITSALVDVHGQSEHFYLLKESNQLKLLDAMGGVSVAAAKAAVAALVVSRKAILSDLERLGGDEGERARRMDILSYQADEIQRAGLREGEEEELKERSIRFRNAERILDGLAAAKDALLSDGGGADAVRSAERAIGSLTKFDREYDELAERLASVGRELDDIAETVASRLEDDLFDEREAERVEARLDEIKTLKKKYGGEIRDVIAFGERAREEYRMLAESAERREALTEKLNRTDDELYAACAALTEARKTAADGFCKRVMEELKGLNIPSACFRTEFDRYEREDVGHATQDGLGGMRFLFSANAGEPPKELGKIISGGEMSRFMLAVKAQLSSIGSIGTYIFDEIDAGIGGKTARVVAEKFASIAKSVQLIAVTHLAQIAAYADREFLIEKREEDGKTFTRIREVREEERLGELARLIGGTSEHVLAHARELIDEGKAYKKSL